MTRAAGFGLCGRHASRWLCRLRDFAGQVAQGRNRQSMSLDSKLAMPPAAPLESARVLRLASPAAGRASGTFPRHLLLFIEELKRLSRTMCLVRLPLLHLIRSPRLCPGNDGYKMFGIPSRDSVSILLAADHYSNCSNLHMAHRNEHVGDNDPFTHSV